MENKNDQTIQQHHDSRDATTRSTGIRLSMLGGLIMSMQDYEETIEQPTMEQLEEWFMDGVCETPDGCRVEPDGTCPHGQESWMLILGLI